MLFLIERSGWVRKRGRNASCCRKYHLSIVKAFNQLKFNYQLFRLLFILFAFYLLLEQQQNETQQSVLSTVQQEMASRRSKLGSFSRQDSRLSVKTLIESIENNKQVKRKLSSETWQINLEIQNTKK